MNALRRGLDRLRGRPAWTRDAASAWAEGVRAHAAADPLAAAEAWLIAAKAGHVEAQFRLGQLYERGEGVLAAAVEAAHWYEAAARQGHAGAQERLAVLCLCAPGRGENGGTDESASDGAAGANDLRPGGATADHRGGVGALLFPNGRSFRRDPTAARHWARQAAEQGVASAQALLAYLLAAGLGGAVDAEGALHWYREAAKQDCPQQC